MNDPKLAWQIMLLRYYYSKYVLEGSGNKQFEKSIKIVGVQWLRLLSSCYFLILLYCLEPGEPLFKDGYQLDDHFILGTYNVLGEEKADDEVPANDKNQDP